MRSIIASAPLSNVEKAQHTRPSFLIHFRFGDGTFFMVIRVISTWLLEACFRIDLAADCVLNVNSGLISLEDHRAAAPATPEVIRNLFQMGPLLIKVCSTTEIGLLGIWVGVWVGLGGGGVGNTLRCPRNFQRTCLAAGSLREVLIKCGLLKRDVTLRYFQERYRTFKRDML